MLKWKANLAQDSDGLYNAQQMINQLTQGLPLANESTVQLADTYLDENSDWSKINYNEYYLFDSLMGLNAPDKQSLIYDRGLTIKIGDSNEFIQLAITQDGIGVKYNNNKWSYLLNGSGGSGTSGNYVIDNKDGTVHFNGVTVTLATSKDVQSLTNLINLKLDQLTNVIPQLIDPNADLFAIKQAGVYKSVWGNQNTLKNFPSPDGSATIIYSGSGNTDNGIKITVIDSWGSVFESTWQGLASTPGYSPWKNVTDVAIDSKVVHDNKDGTEQLNGVQVQPFNKLSDTIGGRNLLAGTSEILQTVTNATGWNTNLPQITPVATAVDSATTYTARAWLSPASHDMQVQVVWTDSSGTTYYGSGNTISAGTSGYSTWTGTFTAGTTIQRVTIIFIAEQTTASTVSYKEMKLEKGSVATDWTPAPEDVNQQLATKVTDNKDGTEQLNGVKVQPFNKLTDTIGGQNLLTGTSGTLQTVTNASEYNTNLPSITPVVTTIDSATTYTARAWLSPASHDMQVQVVWTDSSGTTYYEGGNTISAGTSGYSTWTGTFTAGTTIQRVTIIFIAEQTTASTVSYKEMKLEKGSVATDWCPNLSEILTQLDYAKIQAAIVAQNSSAQIDVNDSDWTTVLGNGE